MAQITETEKKGLSSFILRILASIAYVAVYASELFLKDNIWIKNLNWFALPVFTFLLAEGINKTSDKVLYLRRLVLFTLISELPFNLYKSGKLIYPKEQSVMCTLLIAFLCLWLLDLIRTKINNIAFDCIAAAVLMWAGSFICKKANCYMASAGVITAILFYLASHVTYKKLMQLLSVLYFAANVASSYMTTPQIGNYIFKFPAQIFALPALLLIMFYKDKRGPNSLKLKIIFYAAYPFFTLLFALLTMYAA